jgi:hypothetical protein
MRTVWTPQGISCNCCLQILGCSDFVIKTELAGENRMSAWRMCKPMQWDALCEWNSNLNNEITLGDF